MLPVSISRQHAPTPPQPSPFRQWPCAWEQTSSAWHYRSGLGAQNWHLITRRNEFSVLCTETCTDRSAKLTVFSRFSAWVFHEHSTRKDQSFNLLVLLRVPAIAWKPFCTAKGDSLLKGCSSLANLTTMNLGQLSFVRKISSSDFESESESGLVLFLRFGKAKEAIFRRKVIHHT